MRNKGVKPLCGILSAAILLGGIKPISAEAAHFGWEIGEDGCLYWYEGGVKQGTEGRGKEIYDPAAGAWYWLDSVDGGKRAEGKDVYQDSDAGPYGDREDGTGKWCRYDENGGMVKGWDVNGNGTYYFDYTYGAMLKGSHEIDGVQYSFNQETGIMESCGVGMENRWAEVGGVLYWYEGGIRQGYDPHEPSYRGKEIYDPGSDAWYWLDNVEGGRKAVSKDVYQEYEDGTGKWVRYDANGRMVKGWNEKDGNRYYFDPVTGAMAKGIAVVDGKTYEFDSGTGVCLDEYQGDVQTVWVLEKEEYVYDGGEKYAGIYEYDKNTGYLSKDIIKGFITEYERDGQGRTLHSVMKKQEDGSLYGESFYTYDSEGNILDELQIRHAVNGRAENSIYTEYKYKDGLLQMEKITDYLEEKATVFGRREYSYDKYGNRVEYIYSRKEIGWTTYQPQSRETYEYDQFGSVVKTVSYKWNKRTEDWEESKRREQTYMYVNNKAYVLSITDCDTRFSNISSVQYERNADGSAKKCTSYRNNEISEYVVYGQALPPKEGDSYININTVFDKEGGKMREEVYYYTKLTISK